MTYHVEGQVVVDGIEHSRDGVSPRGGVVKKLEVGAGVRVIHLGKRPA